MELPTGLVIKESPIDGLGVFALTDIPSGQWLGDFVGEEMSLTDFLKKYGRDYRYCMRLRRINKVLVAKERRNWITYINDGVKGFDTPQVNVVCKRRGCYTARDIRQGEELLLDYGKSYPW